MPNLLPHRTFGLIMQFSLANLKISEPFGADNGTTGPQATSFVGGASLAQLGLAWPGLARFFTRLSSARIRERCQGTIAQFFAPPDLWVFSLTFHNHNKEYVPIYGIYRAKNVFLRNSKKTELTFTMLPYSITVKEHGHKYHII